MNHWGLLADFAATLSCMRCCINSFSTVFCSVPWTLMVLCSSRCLRCVCPSPPSGKRNCILQFKVSSLFSHPVTPFIVCKCDCKCVKTMSSSHALRFRFVFALLIIRSLRCISSICFQGYLLSQFSPVNHSFKPWQGTQMDYRSWNYGNRKSSCLNMSPLVKGMIESLSEFSTHGALSALAEVYLSCLMCLDECRCCAEAALYCLITALSDSRRSNNGS